MKPLIHSTHVPDKLRVALNKLHNKMDSKTLRLAMAKQLQPWLAQLKHAYGKRLLKTEKRALVKELFVRGLKVRSDFARLFAADASHPVHDTKKLTLKSIIRHYEGKPPKKPSKKGGKKRGKARKKTKAKPKQKTKPKSESTSDSGSASQAISISAGESGSD
jgi:hypothetical protein